VKTLAKLLGRSNLDALPSSQNCVINKGEIDFTHRKEQKYKKKILNFRKPSTSLFVTHFYCLKKGHASNTCVSEILVFIVGSMFAFSKETKITSTSKDSI